MLTFLKGIIPSMFSLRIPPRDRFLELLDSAQTITMDTELILTHFTLLVESSEQTPEHAINRFMVRSVTLHKHTSSMSEHEYLTFDIYDSCKGESSDGYDVFLERTTSGIRMDSSYFTAHPDSSTMLSAILNSLKSSNTTAPPDESGDTIPLIDIPSSASPVTPARSSSPVTPARSFSRVLDAASLSSVRSIHGSAGILRGSKVISACDQFLLGRLAKQTHGNGRIIRQFEPRGLTLFHLIVLANTVHAHDPLYSLLSRQCYWFSNTIYHVISENFKRDDTPTRADVPSDEIEEVRIPPDAYLPEYAGRCMGVLVSVISEPLMYLIQNKFDADYDTEFAKVCFYIN
jgi:hypothetical protein